MSYLTEEIIDVHRLAEGVVRESDGAVVTFDGVVRNHHEGKQVEAIEYHAYRDMAEKEIEKVIRSVRDEHPHVAISVVHRLGLLRVGETSIAIACASTHRADSFEACRKIIDRVKDTVPIWKKELGPDGSEWVGWQGTRTDPVPEPGGSD
jgi:molybdopterin synthase catalytic subunit